MLTRFLVSLATDNAPDCGLAYTELLTDLRLRNASTSIQAPDFSRVLHCEPGVGIVLAAAPYVPIATRHISHIVELIAKIKMVRSHTRRIITMMQNVRPLGNGAVRKFVRYTVSSKVSIIEAKDPVVTTQAKSRGCPNPAVAGSVYVGPESLNVTRGILAGHWMLLTSSAMPRLLATARGFFVPQFYHSQAKITRLRGATLA